MRIWLALLVAPLLALLDQGIAYALAGWACARQDTVSMQALHALFLVATLAATFLAWQLRKATPGGSAVEEAMAARRFLAGVATASGALSSLIIFAMWVPTWVVAACFN